jgi:hypothetical protein
MDNRMVPVTSQFMRKFFYQYKIAETYVIPLRPSAYKEVGCIRPLLLHLSNWQLEFECGYWLRHPHGSEPGPVLLVLGCNPLEAHTLAVLSGYDWTFHCFLHPDSRLTLEKGEFGYGTRDNVHWHYKRNVYD